MLIVRDKEGESAGALIKDPKPVIADEHITSLDAESAGITGDMLKRAMEGGRTAILTTHQDRKLPDTAKAQPRIQDYQRH